ncbi:hypothetical protein NDU88_005074 [Pleurodeles waltl]|uniref:Uncharacterized protein n=1 Tax=Pleurodeles waltl TaxID=8319 RepID=A0AAV7WAV0_PLEWA|nr:hypothetical protein NDU88_005074 [Pleurodeles waltl]
MVRHRWHLRSLTRRTPATRRTHSCSWPRPPFFGPKFTLTPLKSACRERRSSHRRRCLGYRAVVGDAGCRTLLLPRLPRLEPMYVFM